MLLPIVFFQVCVTLLLIGVLARKGLLLSDPAFTAAVGWFFVAPATLWVFAQAAWTSRAYENLYIACLGVALGLASVIVYRQPHGWQAGVLAVFGGVLILAIVGSIPAGRATYAIAFSAPVQLVYALYALTQSTKADHPFTKLELMGMGFFWLGQAIVAGAYVVGVVRAQQPQVLATNLGAGACAVAFLWMAVTLWYGGAESLTPLKANEGSKDERGGWMQAEGATAKVRR